MKIHLGGVGKGGVGILDNGGVCQAAAEHSHTVHRYVITVRHVLGVGKGSMGKSRDEVVGTGRN